MFVEQRTRQVLAELCRFLGRSPTDATLLRHHTNAVYALDDLVVKIAPPVITPDRLRGVVILVEWLTHLGFPTVRLAPDLDQPIQIDGYGVTVWERLDAKPITTLELGDLLRRLHGLDGLPPVALPELDPLGNIQRSIDRSTILSSDERQFLERRLTRLSPSWPITNPPLGSGLIQTDPQVRNALRRPNGTAVLADWDAACNGPRLWDIATVAVHCQRFGTQKEYVDFTTTYGRDPSIAPTFENLCQLRELQMIATNARKSMPGSAAADEVHRRIAGLRNAGPAAAWNIL